VDPLFPALVPARASVAFVLLVLLDSDAEVAAGLPQLLPEQRSRWRLSGQPAFVVLS
jgi:hypothetical protein